MKKRILTAAAALALILSLGVFFYPVFGNWRTDNTHAELLAQFEENIADKYEHQLEALLLRAEEVNAYLSKLGPDQPLEVGVIADIPDDYTQILYVDGLMGSIEIPAINVNLPIFHSTSDAALERGVGHLEGTSFPVGGEGTHAALTAHSGLATARLFSDLEELSNGDLFYIHVLDRQLTYVVDQVLVVYPHEIEHLRIVAGEDFVTLITCVPYTVNTHRLLVRGTRVHDYD